jgi:hypothetical protein
LIIVLLKSQEYGKKLRNIVKKEFLKLTSTAPLKVGKLKETKVNSSTNVIGEKQQLQDVINANNTKIIHEEFKTQNKQDLISLKCPEQKVILDFEIFCFKWERYIIVDKQYIKINDTIEIIRKCFSDNVYND